jgi:hypothetical protein
MTAFSHNFDDLRRRVITLTFPNAIEQAGFLRELNFDDGQPPRLDRP